MQNGKIYTIGYAGFRNDIEKFLDILEDYSVDEIIDVRSFPSSDIHYNFNGGAIKLKLQTRDNLKGDCKTGATCPISYTHMPVQFGARQSNKELYPKGYLDFELFSKQASFVEGIESVEQMVSEGKNVCLLCSEPEPTDCHRCILIARAFWKKNYPVTHLFADKIPTTQKDIEQKWIEKYKREHETPGQMSFEGFSEENNEKDEQEIINEAYRKRNEKIGYRMEET